MLLKELFGGEVGTQGLTNESSLAKKCPRDFLHTNEWSFYVINIHLYSKTRSTKNWEWRSKDATEQQKQLTCLHGLLGHSQLESRQVHAIAGWMLSLMLKKVPEFSLRKPK